MTSGSPAQFSMICEGSSTKSRGTFVPASGLVGAVGEQVVKGVAELVEERRGLLEGQERRLVARRHGEVPDVVDDGVTVIPSRTDWVRNVLDQAPPRLLARGK